MRCATNGRRSSSRPGSARAPRSSRLLRFCDVRIHPVARRDHPLASCGTPIPPALLRAHPQIVLRDSAHDPASPSLNVLEGGLRWTVTDVTAKRDVILAGMGWGGLPEHVVADALASRTVVRLRGPGVRDRGDGAVRDAASRPRARRGRAGVVGGAQAQRCGVREGTPVTPSGGSGREQGVRRS